MPDQRALANLLRLGSAQREDALLQAQMAQAAQLAQPRGRQYGTAGGAILGGLGDAIREMGGGFRQQALQGQAADTERGRVDARQQWLSAALRGQPPPAGVLPPAASPQEQVAGMAAALRRRSVDLDLAKSAPGGGMAGTGGVAPALDAMTTLAPYQPGPILGMGAAPVGTPAAHLATLAGSAGQAGGSAPIGMGVMASTPLAQPAAPTGKPMSAGDRLRAKLSQPAATYPPPAGTYAEEQPLTQEQYAEIAIASGDPAMMAWGKTVLEQANLRAAMEAKRLEQEAKSKGDTEAAAAKQKAEADKFGHEQAAKFMKQPVVEAAQQSRLALEKIKREAQRKTAFGDVAMVYGVITTFDPKSGVKEGEVALAEQAKGVPSYVVGLYNRAVSGQRLTDEQRADILAAAENMYQAQAAPAIRLADYYAGTLSRAGLDPAEYLPDLSLSSAPKAPKAKTKPPDVLERGDRRFKRLSDGTYEEIE